MRKFNFSNYSRIKCVLCERFVSPFEIEELFLSSKSLHLLVLCRECRILHKLLFYAFNRNPEEWWLLLLHLEELEKEKKLE